MTQYAVSNDYCYSKILLATILYIFFHKLTWTTSRFNSSVMANVLKL